MAWKGELHDYKWLFNHTGQYASLVVWKDGQLWRRHVPMDIEARSNLHKVKVNLLKSILEDQGFPIKNEEDFLVYVALSQKEVKA